jgi:hypothetical protein
MIILEGTQAACGTTSGAASTFGAASAVRLINTHTSAHLVTLEEAGGTDIGTFTLAAGASEVVKKSPTDKIFAANAGVLGVAVGFSY